MCQKYDLVLQRTYRHRSRLWPVGAFSHAGQLGQVDGRSLEIKVFIVCNVESSGMIIINLWNLDMCFVYGRSVVEIEIFVVSEKGKCLMIVSLLNTNI